MERIINSFGRPDLIHGHSFMAGYAALEISERFEIPFVITEHYQGFNRSIKRRHRRIIQEVFNSANARLAVSDSLKRKLGAYTDRLIQVIPNLVNEKRFVFHARSMTYPIEFIAIGGLSKRKRFQQLITYFLKWKDQYHVDAILTIIGAGETLSHLRKIIEAANAHDHVQLIGHLSRSDLAVALKKAHVLLSLSKSETFGLAVAEGLISGIPAIVTKSGGPEVLINDQNGIVIEEATYKHFSSAMNRMIDNYDKIDHLAIRKTMIDRIGTTVVCERIKGVYEQIIS